MVGLTDDELLSNGPDAYMKAMIQSKNIEGVKKALELGANVNLPGNIYLYSVTGSYKFNIELLELLMDAGIEFDPEILLRLYEDGHTDAIKLVEKNYGIEFISEMKKSRPNDYLKYGLLKNNINIIRDAIKLIDNIWGIFIWFAINRQCDYEIVYLLMFLCNEFDEDIYNIFNRNKSRNPEYYNDNLLKLIKSFEESLKLKNK